MKKGLKQYQKQIKINQNNDMFTTYQKPHSTSQHHQIKSKDTSSQQSQHHHIESLKNTLKSINQINSMEVTRTIERKYDFFMDQNSPEFIENYKYNLKLSQLSKNLQEIASKCHFSHSNTAILKNKPVSNNTSINTHFQPNISTNLNIPKSQTKKHINQSNTSLNKSINLLLNQKGQNNNKSMNIERNNNKSSKDLNKLDKSKSHLLQSKEKSKMKQRYKQSRQISRQLSQKNKDKKTIINEESFKNSISKNLLKVFENQLQKSLKNKQKMTKQSKNGPYLFKSNIHRHAITNILLSDHIYTSSLDYNINRLSFKDDQYVVENMATMRGGVNHIGFINNMLYGCSRDSYLRSVNGNYHHKFDSIPLKFYELERNSQITISFFNKTISNFDVEKRIAISVLSTDYRYEIMQKNSKQIFIGGLNNLSILDWRHKHHAIDLVRFSESVQCKWMSDPCSSAFCYESQNQLSALDEHFKTAKSVKLNLQSTYKNYDWNRGGHYILGCFQSADICKVWKYDANLNSEQIDTELKGNKAAILKIRDKKLFYGCSDGQLLIKCLKR